jgi:hypothetical protein
LLLIAMPAYAGLTVIVGGAEVGEGIQEGSDVTLGSGVFSTTLDEATGTDVAVLINYTTDCAGCSDTGLEINMWDIASPGTSYGLNFKVGGASKARIDNTGLGWFIGGVQASSIQSRVNSQAITLQGGRTFTTGGVKSVTISGTHTGSTGTIGLAIQSMWDQTDAAYGTDFLISRDEIAVGSGAQLLFDAQVDDVSQFSIDNNGSSDTGGAVAFSGISTVTADYAIGNFADDPIYFIECDAALGNVSTTMPPVADKKGRLMEIKLMSAANGCYIDGNGAETIDGSLGQTITTQYDSLSFIAGSSEWLIR